MTTRNQKRSNDTNPANTSESGAVLDMLTSVNTNGNKTRIGEITQTDPAAVAKDVISVNLEDTTSTDNQEIHNSKSADPASAKDQGKLFVIYVEIKAGFKSKPFKSLF